MKNVPSTVPEELYHHGNVKPWRGTVARTASSGVTARPGTAIARRTKPI